MKSILCTFSNIRKLIKTCRRHKVLDNNILMKYQSRELRFEKKSKEYKPRKKTRHGKQTHNKEHEILKITYNEIKANEQLGFHQNWEHRIDGADKHFGFFFVFCHVWFLNVLFCKTYTAAFECKTNKLSANDGCPKFIRFSFRQEVLPAL